MAIQGLTRARNAVHSAVRTTLKMVGIGGKSMPQHKIRSFSAQKGTVRPQWLHVDASDEVLGRLAVKIARVLMGKHRPTYTRHVDTGDFVVVTNAHRIRVTGHKADTMVYPRYSYYPGGYKEIPFKRVLERHPERILKEAVRRMLPKTSLGRQMFKKLKVYATDTHPHAAQQPQPWTSFDQIC